MTVARENSSYGLKEDWDKVQRILEEIIPVYDKTNRYISLGADLKLRKRGIDLLVDSTGKANITTLDLGSGTGKMAIELASRVPNGNKSITMLDPIAKMAQVAKLRTGGDPVIAMFERLPFREGSFEAATAGFSIRDARDLNEAIIEVSKVLKQGGKFLVVDLAKPDSKLRSGAIMFYWDIFAPTIAFISSGRLGLKFGALARTFRRLPRITEFITLLKDAGFNVLKMEQYLIGGSCIILLEKARNV